MGAVSRRSVPQRRPVWGLAGRDWACAYNHDGCHAFAVSINADGECATFLRSDGKGGVEVVAQVGACQRLDCAHNKELECHAPYIRVGAGTDDADCLSYQPTEQPRP